jgi:transposase InsO family protein
LESLAEEYPVAVACDVLGCSRSTYYYREVPADDDRIRQAIRDVAAEFPKYGYRRVTEQLKRQGYRFNHKRILPLMREMGLTREVKRRKRRTTNSRHGYRRYPNLVQGVEVARMDQIWVADVTYVRLREEFIYLAVIMDVFTRAIRGWNLSRSIDARLTVDALTQALSVRRPETHHSDQGIHYAATAYTDLLDLHGVRISMADVGQAWQNGYCERVHRTIKEEEIELADYRDFADARRQIGRFLEEVYMKKRIHSSLGYLTPAEFEERCLAGNVAPFTYK